MKKNFNYIILLVVLTLAFPVNAQIRYGKVTYERKTNLYKKFKGDVKEWISESEKNKIDDFELFFNDTLSLFRPVESELRDRMSWATAKNTVYQNFNTSKKFTVKTIWGEALNVTDSLSIRKWKMTDHSRTIAGYKCRKAVWHANDSTRIYAWFAQELQVSTGPESYNGLPGVILGLATEDGGVVYFAKKVEIIKPDNQILYPPKTKIKIYTTKELKSKLEKEYGKEKWGKQMINEHFGIW